MHSVHVKLVLYINYVTMHRIYGIKVLTRFPFDVTFRWNSKQHC